MIRFEVKAGFKNLENWLKDLAGKQLPFVTAKTLTDLAGEVNSEAVKELRRVFTLRNKYVINSFRRTMAKKSQWPNCESTAGSTAEFMELQVRGGDKRAKGDVPLGVPLGARPSNQDMIQKPLWVRHLLHKMGYINITSIQGRELLLKQTQSGKTKVIKNAHQRNRHRIHHTGKRGWKRETLYVLKKGVMIPVRFDFEKIAVDTVAKSYVERFRKNLEKSLVQ